MLCNYRLRDSHRAMNDQKEFSPGLLFLLVLLVSQKGSTNGAPLKEKAASRQGFCTFRFTNFSFQRNKNH